MTTTYLRQVNGALTEARTVSTSAGAGDVDKVPSLNAAGVLPASITNAVATSAGAGDAGKLVALDGSGRIDTSAMPVGVGPDTNTITATEALAAGDYVNVHSGGVRKADASNGRPAHGVVLAGVANGAPATVYFEGTNTQLSGLTLGADQYLSATTPGARTATAPSTAGQLVQPLGVAVSTTAAQIEIRQPITLA